MNITLDLTNKELDNLISSIKYSQNQVQAKFTKYPKDDKCGHSVETRQTLSNTHIRYTKLLIQLESKRDEYIKSQQARHS